MDELGEAVVVNPHHPDALVAALQTALEMPQEEIGARMRSLRAAVAANDVHGWATDFLEQLTGAGAP